MSFWVAGAMVVGSAVSANQSSNAATAASNASAAATDASIDQQNQQYETTRQDNMPFMNSGYNAMNALNTRLGLAQVSQNGSQNQFQSAGGGQAGGGQGAPGMYDSFQGSQEALPQYSNNSEALPQFQNNSNFEFDLEADAGYNFAKEEAVRSASRAAAGQGGYNSGNRLAAISDRVTGVASQYADQSYNRQLSTSQENFGRDVNRYGMDTTRNNTNYSRNLTDYGVAKESNDTQYNRDLTEYGLGVSRNTDMYGRDQDYLNRLASMAGMGQTSVSNTGVTGANAANNIGAYMNNNASNQANAAYTNASGNNNAIQGGLSNWLTYQNMNQGAPSGGGGANTYGGDWP